MSDFLIAYIFFRFLPEAPEKSKEKPLASACLKAESCYHIEVKLPGDTETASVDLIMFDIVAKLLTDEKLKVTILWCSALFTTN